MTTQATRHARNNQDFGEIISPNKETGKFWKHNKNKKEIDVYKELKKIEAKEKIEKLINTNNTE